MVKSPAAVPIVAAHILTFLVSLGSLSHTDIGLIAETGAKLNLVPPTTVVEAFGST